MKILIFFSLFVLNCKHVQNRSNVSQLKDVTPKSIEEITDESRYKFLDHAPLESGTTRYIVAKDIIAKEAKDPAKVQLLKNLEEVLLSEGVMQAANIDASESLDKIMQDAPIIEVHFHNIQNPGIAPQLLINDSKNDPTITMNIPWEMRGKIPPALLKDQINTLNSALQGKIRFNFDPANFFAQRYITGAVAQTGFCKKDPPSTMSCFASQDTFGQACEQSKCAYNVNSQWFFVDNPPVPTIMSEYWPANFISDGDRYAGWQRFLGRALMKNEGLYYAAADPTHLHIVTGSSVDLIYGMTPLFPWLYKYPYTYPEPQDTNSRVQHVPPPVDSNGHGIPPDVVYIDQNFISDIGYMLDPRYSNRDYYGGTLVHEVGHWLGLFHVFNDTDAIVENGVYTCLGPCKVGGGYVEPAGDLVADTPAAAKSLQGGLIHPNASHNNCNTDPAHLVDTCENFDGFDPQRNAMNYVIDRCTLQNDRGAKEAFTPGQIDRMLEFWAVRLAKYNEYLLNRPLSVVSSAAMDGGPNHARAIVDSLVNEAMGEDVSAANTGQMQLPSRDSILINLAQKVSTIKKLYAWANSNLNQNQIFLPYIGTDQAPVGCSVP